jgi:hypothetical protein
MRAIKIFAISCSSFVTMTNSLTFLPTHLLQEFHSHGTRGGHDHLRGDWAGNRAPKGLFLRIFILLMMKMIAKGIKILCIMIREETEREESLLDLFCDQDFPKKSIIVIHKIMHRLCDWLCTIQSKEKINHREAALCTLKRQMLLASILQHFQQYYNIQQRIRQ